MDFRRGVTPAVCPMSHYRQSQTALAAAARHGLRRGPARGQLELLLGAAVGTDPPGIARQLRGANALRELPQTIRQERGHEHEMRDGDEDARERDAPPSAECSARAPDALPPIERLDCDGTTGGRAAIAAERERRHAGAVVRRPYSRASPSRSAARAGRHRSAAGGSAVPRQLRLTISSS